MNRKVVRIRKLRTDIEGEAWRLRDTRHVCARCAKPIRWALTLCARCWQIHGVNERVR